MAHDRKAILDALAARLRTELRANGSPITVERRDLGPPQVVAFPTVVVLAAGFDEEWRGDELPAWPSVAALVRVHMLQDPNSEAPDDEAIGLYEQILAALRWHEGVDPVPTSGDGYSTTLGKRPDGQPLVESARVSGGADLVNPIPGQPFLMLDVPVQMLLTPSE